MIPTSPVALPLSPRATSLRLFALIEQQGSADLRQWAEARRAEINLILLAKIAGRWEIEAFRDEQDTPLSSDPLQREVMEDPKAPFGFRLNRAVLMEWWKRAQYASYAPAREQDKLFQEGLDLVWVALALSPNFGPPTRGTLARKLAQVIRALALYHQCDRQAVSAREAVSLDPDQSSLLGSQVLLEAAARMESSKQEGQPAKWPKGSGSRISMTLQARLRGSGADPRLWADREGLFARYASAAKAFPKHHRLQLMREEEPEIAKRVEQVLDAERTHLGFEITPHPALL